MILELVAGGAPEGRLSNAGFPGGLLRCWCGQTTELQAEKGAPVTQARHSTQA